MQLLPLLVSSSSPHKFSSSPIQTQLFFHRVSTISLVADLRSATFAVLAVIWIVSPRVVYEGLKAKEAATVSLGKFGFAYQANQEHHDDYQQAHYGTGRAD